MGQFFPFCIKRGGPSIIRKARITKEPFNSSSASVSWPQPLHLPFPHQLPLKMPLMFDQILCPSQKILVITNSMVDLTGIMLYQDKQDLWEEIMFMCLFQNPTRYLLTIHWTGK
jgi:hypothetical protein